MHDDGLFPVDDLEIGFQDFEPQPYPQRRADTISPAAILGLGIPVGRIGSNPATPAMWADLLLERLER